MKLPASLHLDPRDIARRLALIALGSAILTFGIHNVHQIVGITEGGVIGALLLVNHWFGLPSSIASPILDIVCYAVALRLLGAGFLGWSAVSSACIAGFYALWEHLPHLLPDLTALPLVASIAGGLFVGMGAGLVVRAGASAGGDDALALSIQKLSGWRLSRCYLVTDLSVLGLSLSYIPVTSIVFSLITVCISSPLIDFIVGLGTQDQEAEDEDPVLA
ncbi:YitT family protein [Collinsella tanakaei]|uniref:YitT family protein n=1 Tax=Collinsella tanakaei TaxID=626935 RepID=UPI0025A392F5|nr:YitT family protein [Collinsella tanakaei]MDM8245023.1 YitT family protein [Collinsella tanakaei]